MNPPTILLFLKSPREGEVKTRLARSVGFAEATRIYRRLVEHQIARIPPTWRIQIHFAPAADADQMRTWLGPDHQYFPQVEGDLGERLSAAMQRHFATPASSPLIFVGGDCPYLSTQ